MRPFLGCLCRCYQGSLKLTIIAPIFKRLTQTEFMKTSAALLLSIALIAPQIAPAANDNPPNPNAELNNVRDAIAATEKDLAAKQGAQRRAAQILRETQIAIAKARRELNELTQREQAQKHIGYLPEHNPLYTDMYVKEYLSYVADIYKAPKHRIEESIALTQLESHAHKKIHTLSKGYRQRIGLASTLLHDPDVLILDEPTNGLDPQQILEIRQIIRDLGREKVVLLSSHIMQEIQAVCQRVLILHQGKIILNEPMTALQDKEQTVEVLFDFRVEEQLLRRIPHVKTIHNNEEFFFTLTFDTEEDMRPKLFDFAMENGLKILQMNHRHTDLEALFTSLTKTK